MHVLRAVGDDDAVDDVGVVERLREVVDLLLAVRLEGHERDVWLRPIPGRLVEQRRERSCLARRREADVVGETHEVGTRDAQVEAFAGGVVGFGAVLAGVGERDLLRFGAPVEARPHAERRQQLLDVAEQLAAPAAEPDVAVRLAAALHAGHASVRAEQSAQEVRLHLRRELGRRCAAPACRVRARW